MRQEPIALISGRLRLCIMYACIVNLLPGPAFGCGTDNDCDDHIHCTGIERCQDGRCVGSQGPCAPNEFCDQARDLCTLNCIDADGDGHMSNECGGDDCDDSDPLRFPGNVEVCNANVHDEDCNPDTYGVSDYDGDGYPNANCYRR